jgi:hypothetical protein
MKKRPERVPRDKVLLSEGECAQATAFDGKKEVRLAYRKQRRLTKTGWVIDIFTETNMPKTPFLMWEGPMQGRPPTLAGKKAKGPKAAERPKAKELEEPFTFFIAVSTDFSSAEIRTPHGNPQSAKSNQLAVILDAVCETQEEDRHKARDEKRDYAPDYPYRLNLSTPDKPITENNAHQIATRFRRFLMRCVPGKKRQIIREAIESDGTEIVIAPTLQFYRRQEAADSGEVSLPDNAANILSSKQPTTPIWDSNEEQAIVTAWLKRRSDTLGIAQLAKYRALMRALLGIAEEYDEDDDQR